MERNNSMLQANLHDLNIESQQRLQWLVRSQKYKMFFAGLIFAVISFIGTHPIKLPFLVLKIFEVISSISLLFAGVLLLLRLNELSYKINAKGRRLKECFYGFIFNSNLSYWILFLIGMSLLLFNRAVMLFY